MLEQLIDEANGGDKKKKELAAVRLKREQAAREQVPLTIDVLGRVSAKFAGVARPRDVFAEINNLPSARSIEVSDESVGEQKYQ